MTDSPIARIRIADGGVYDMTVFYPGQERLSAAERDLLDAFPRVPLDQREALLLLVKALVGPSLEKGSR
jgi:hypothetical protein